MKKMNYLFMGILLLFFLTACKGYEIEEIEELPEEEQEIQEEPLIEEEPPQQEEEVVQEQEELEEEFTLFTPELRYSGLYNGPLYATSEQWGDAAPVEEHFENLDRNGVNYVLVFFSVEAGEETEEDLTYIKDALTDYPSRIVPFINPGYGSEEAKPLLQSGQLAEDYEEIITKSNNFFEVDTIKGFGELEIYAWGQATNTYLLPIYDTAEKNKLHVMLHPTQGTAHVDALEEILETYPHTLFLLHLFPEDFHDDSDQYIKLLQEHENVYFSIDADHMLYDGQTGLLYKFEDESTEEAVEDFIAEFDTNYKRYINDAVLQYKPLVDAVPDKVMWGTEMGLAYTYDPEVYDRIVLASRTFIAQIDPENQEKLAYKNALAVFGEGVILD